MKKLLFVLLISIQSVFAQNIVGSWSGELVGPGFKIPLIINISEKEGVLKTTLDSPSQGQKDLSTKETRFENNELSIDASSLGIKYKGKLNADGIIEGTFFQGGGSAPLNFIRAEEKIKPNRPQTPTSPYNYYTEDVEFKNETEGNLLAGTLAAPNQNKDIPVFVMITGSGAQNRDSELADHKSFLVIADYLAKKGIGTLRLDDRSIGGSELGKQDPTSLDFAGDINTAVNFLVKKGYKTIGLIGHSEGGIIGPLVAASNNKVNSLILLAGPGVAVKELLPEQYSNLLQAYGIEKAKVITIKDNFKKLLDEFVLREKPFTPNEITERLKSVFKEVDENKARPLVNEIAPLFVTSWGKYFIGYNPSLINSKLKIPVLAINGSLDMNVPAKENLKGIRNSLEKAGNKNFEIVEFEGLNHLFQTTKTGAPSEYGVIEETIAPQVLEKIADWILKLNK